LLKSRAVPNALDGEAVTVIRRWTIGVSLQCLSAIILPAIIPIGVTMILTPSGSDPRILVIRRFYLQNPVRAPELEALRHWRCRSCRNEKWQQSKRELNGFDHGWPAPRERRNLPLSSHSSFSASASARPFRPWEIASFQLRRFRPNQIHQMRPSG